MPGLDTTTLGDEKRFFLPATWMGFTVNNTNSTDEEFYLGLPAPAVQRSFANGAYQGFRIGEAALAVQAGSCDLLSGANLTAALDGMKTSFAFHLSVPAAHSKTLTVVVAYYRNAAHPKYYGLPVRNYPSLFPLHSVGSSVKNIMMRLCLAGYCVRHALFRSCG
jgi:hypothetical protein